MNTHLDPDTIERLMKFNPPGTKNFVKKIFSTFVSDTQNRFDAAKLQFSGGDTSSLTKSCHAMQGSCRSVGANDLAKLLQSIEIEGTRGAGFTEARLIEAEKIFKEVCLELNSHLI